MTDDAETCMYKITIDGAEVARVPWHDVLQVIGRPIRDGGNEIEQD